MGMALGSALLAAPALAFQAPDSLARLENRIREAVSRARPAAVRVSALNPGSAPLPPAMQLEPAAAIAPYRSIGSGLVVDSRGYVLTNAHVIGNSPSIRVRLWRNPPVDYAAELFHVSKAQDLAVVRLQGTGPFPVASFGKAGAMHTGDAVIAVGSPYGLEHTVSMGIVSRKLDSLWIDGRQYRDLIQTDAAINQGNSGGPLLDLDGEVVGINTAIYAPRGVFAGVGFAIAADRAAAYLTSVLPGNGVGLAAATATAAKPPAKEPIVAGTPAPHPQYPGKCSDCHTLLPPPSAKPAGPRMVTIAAQVPFGSASASAAAVDPVPRNSEGEPIRGVGTPLTIYDTGMRWIMAVALLVVGIALMKWLLSAALARGIRL